MRQVTILFLLAWILHPSAGDAQFIQYDPPGDFRGPAESRAAIMERAVESARWRFSRVLVNPWFAIRNLSYVDTEASASGESDPDFSASVGAGLDAYVPLGESYVVGGYARPEYVWWQDNADRRRLNGRAGLGLFGGFGRIGLELSAERVDESQFFSRELEERVNQRADGGEILVTVDLGRRISWFGGADLRRFEAIEDDPLLDSTVRPLDREELITRTGFGFHVRDQFRLGVGVEQTEADFEATGPRDRSNSGDAIFAELRYTSPRATAVARVASRTIDPETGSSFVPFDGETGLLELSWRPLGRLQVAVRQRRNLSFSIDERSAFYESEISTLALRSAFGSRASLRLFYEDGVLDFETVTPGLPDRKDDLTGFGATLQLRLGRTVLSVSGAETEYDSNLPGFDRTVTSLRANAGWELFGDGSSGPWR